MLISGAQLLGSWVFHTPHIHRDSQQVPPAEPHISAAQLHLSFLTRPGVSLGVGENPLTKPKIKHPEFDIPIPTLPLAYQ